MTSYEIGFNYYSDLEIFDDSNLEYLLPAFMSQIQFDSLDIKSNFFTSMIHLKLSNYDQALAMGFNYHDDNPDDFKVYELIGDIYFEKESWDDALFYYIRSILNDKDNVLLKDQQKNLSILAGKYHKYKIDMLHYIIYGNEYCNYSNYSSNSEIPTGLRLWCKQFDELLKSHKSNKILETI